MKLPPLVLFAIMAAVLVAIGVFQSVSVALNIVNLCLISAIMALGVNMQWGYAGLFNVGIMGFAALGGVAAIIISIAPIGEAWEVGAGRMAMAAVMIALTVAAVIFLRRRLEKGRQRSIAIFAAVVIGYIAARYFFDPAVDEVEAINPALSGYFGGLGLPVVLAWFVGGLLAAGAAWLIGKITLGLRSDYLAIATLGISEIIIFIAKNEDWLTRGVKNVTGIPRPWLVPYEVDLQESAGFIARADSIGIGVIDASTISVKLLYAFWFLLILAIIMWLSERALNSPWGRMMRAIRDNEVSAEAMGKNVTGRHLQIFVLGSAVVGIAGAMLVTLEGQFTPTSYNPLRYTFLIWVMVIVGGSGNNWGSVFGAFLIWTVWIQAEALGPWLMGVLTSGLADGNAAREHLMEAAPHMRMVLMGAILLAALRFSPRGLIPERTITS
ncbi:MAG: branched-chain amino acid ABC transporter permease [Pseudomonadota bacterium]